MKQFLLIVTASIFTLTLAAQANNKGKGKAKDKTATTSSTDKGKSTVSTDKGKSKEKEDKAVKDRSDHEKKIWEGTYASSADGPKPSKNQPAKVRANFQRDYPNATNVYWSKYRGDWTATFRNGPWMSTAVYHANGDRRDTRTIVTREQTPQVILDDIFKKKPDAKVDEVVEVEFPKSLQKIFRIKSIVNGQPQYFYYNKDGTTTTYNY